MKRLFLLVCFLTTFGCTHYFVRDSSQYDLSKEDLDFLKSKKIGLIGFYPYDYFTTSAGFSLDGNSEDLSIRNELHLQMIRFVNDNPQKMKILNESKNNFIQYSKGKNGGIIRRQGWFYRDKEIIQFLEFGKGLKTIEGKGVNKSIPVNNLKQFLSDYLYKTKHLGLDVLEPLLITPNNKQNGNILRMKEFDLDYWVVAYHEQIFQQDKKGGSIASLLLDVFSVLTLTTFPLIREKDIESIFFLYDKKLNLIQTFGYKEKVTLIGSWWVLWVEDAFNFPGPEVLQVPATIYKPDVKQFSKELVQVLKK